MRKRKGAGGGTPRRRIDVMEENEEGRGAGEERERGREEDAL